MNLSPRLNRLFSITAMPQSALAVAPPTPANRDPGASQVLDFVWESGDAFGWDRIGACLLIALSIALVLLWPCAKLIARTKGAFGKTLLFGGSMLALTAAFLALAAVLVRLESIPVLVGLGVIYLAILFTQARHHFQASRPAAAGVLGCFIALAAGGLYAAERLSGPTPWMAFFAKSAEDQGRMFAEWRKGKMPPTPAATPIPTATLIAATPATAPTIQASPSAPIPSVPAAKLPPPPPAPTRGAPDLQALYSQLQKARATLDPNDPEAVARFNQQAEAYNQEKAFANAAMPPAPKAIPTKAPQASATSAR